MIVNFISRELSVRIERGLLGEAINQGALLLNQLNVRSSSP